MDNLELILVFVVIFVIVPILLALLKNEQQKQKKNKKTTKKQIALKMVTCLACEKNGSDEMFKELQKLVALNYSELVDYLLQKYGPAKNDYFCNESCKSKSKKVTRTSEGLFCHHIDEDKEILLSEPAVAQSLPFEYQKANRLVYCNYFEHILLHAKITEENTSNKQVGVGGMFLISEPLNDIYTYGMPESGWRRNVALPIWNEYKNYIFVLVYCTSILQKKRLFNPNDLCRLHSGEYNDQIRNDMFCQGEEH